MTRAIVWKEFREQGAVLLALVGLGSGLMAATAILNSSSVTAEGISVRSVNAVGPIMLVMLVMTAGIVCGGSLFAGEREAGTFTYLDHLPGRRWSVWWRKVLAGGFLAAMSALLLLLAAALANQLGGTQPRILFGWALAVLLLAAVGFGWGAFGSVRAESSLGACGLGLGGAVAATGVSLVVVILGLTTYRSVAVGWAGPPPVDEGTLIGLLTLWSLVFIPLPLSAWSYTRTDRSRMLAEQDIRPAGWSLSVLRLWRPRMGGFGASRRMGWLVGRQYRLTLLVQPLIALGVGFLLVPWNESWPPPSLIWPAVGLVFGVMAGVAGLSDEQRSGAVRFWAERRLPVGRLWRAKVFNGAMLVVLLVGVALLPPWIGMLARGSQHRATTLGAMFDSGLFERTGPQLTYLFLGPVYGFAFGHLAGMLFQKEIVAGAVGLLVGGTVGAAWAPSLTGGDMHGWVAFLPAVVTLLTARWLAWPWATDRLARRGPLLRLAGGVLTAVACVAGGLAFRAFGDLDLPANANAHLQFRDALPTFDETQPGRAVRRSLGRWQELPTVARDAAADRPLAREYAVTYQSPSMSVARTYRWQLDGVLRHGYPAGRPDLDEWLDRVFQGNWDEALFTSAGKPPGVLEDPNEYTGIGTPFRNINLFREVAPVFLARGLQEQVRGDPHGMVCRLDAWLAACRTAKRHTLTGVAVTAEGCERLAYRALDRWLERLDGEPGQVERALEILLRHDRLDQPRKAEVRLAEQVMLQNMVDAPSQWLGRWIEQSPQPVGGARVAGRADAEVNAVAFAWAVPWERERLRRAVAVGNDPARRAERAEALRGAPGLDSFELIERYTDFQSPYSELTVADRRAIILHLALRLHRLSAGGYPATLAELVPARLPAVPTDPYSGLPFRYRRLSTVETVALPSGQVPAGDDALPPGATQSYREYLSVAGLAGGLTGWPFQPGWLPTEMGELPEGNSWPPGQGGPVSRDAGLPLAAEWLGRLGEQTGEREVKLQAGRALVWSVGPDRQDNGGRYMADNRAAGSDLIYPVPEPPASK